MTHGDLHLDGAACGFSLDDAWLHLLLLLPFFFSVTFFLALPASPSEEEVGEGEKNEVEGWGMTLVSYSC